MDNMCYICTKKIQSHSKIMTCLLCQQKIHCKCITVQTSEISGLLKIGDWYCFTCMSDALPFIHIIDEIEYKKTLSEKDHFEISWESYYDKIFNPFTLTDD